MVLLQHFRAFLIAEGLARDPQVAGEAHPLYLDPEDGLPAPGEAQNADERDDELVMGAYHRPGQGTAPLEGRYFRYDAVEVRFRAVDSLLVYELEPQLSVLFQDRINWSMAGKQVIESRISRTLFPAAPFDRQGYRFGVQYQFQTYVDAP